uniref:oligosaccharide flippase family protein n=1 Tax=Pontibacterium sp. TaxID=2036026 RepID=UPI003561BD75
MKSIYKAGWLLSSTQAVGLLATFLRNLLIARLVTPDEYGIAVTFALAISALEMASDFAWDKLIIQSDDGDGARLVNSAHTMMVIRGVLIAAGIFFFADSIAEIFGVPEVASSYELLAVAPLLRGFAHLDVKRFQRKMRFHAEAYVLLFSQLASLASVFALIPFIEDHTLMLYAVITQASVQLISSHYFAERQYGVCFDREMFVRMVVFGWPLILNSFLMIASNEGDKLLVGNAFGVTELALYSIVVMLIYSPGVIIRKTTSSIALPILSKAKDDADAFYKANRIYAGAVMFATVALIVPVSLFGSSFIEDVFGDGYSGPVILVTWLCVGLGAQIIRSWPVTVSLAMGDTKNVLYGNIYR